MDRPEFPVFQYFRGFLWMLCLIPFFMGFSGRRVELVILSTLALGLLPTAAVAFANPLMPATVSAYHFAETCISTGIFGGLCAWFVPKNPTTVYQTAATEAMHVHCQLNNLALSYQVAFDWPDQLFGNA